jgi:4-amino-4-deoxy-L-arabinose transferase-like glycosyltransferase
MRAGKDKIALTAAIVVYLTLGIAYLQTARPWCDEAWFANPAFSLLHSGRMATTELEPAGNYRHPWGIQEYTYWIMPLFAIAQVPWYTVFGFGFASLRSFSLCWGLLGLVAIFEFVRVVSGRSALAAICVALLACDFVYISTAATGRMDMLTAALG